MAGNLMANRMEPHRQPPVMDSGRSIVDIEIARSGCPNEKHNRIISDAYYIEDEGFRTHSEAIILID